MRLLPLATVIWLVTDFVLTWLPRPSLVACGCAVAGLCWLTYSAYKIAAEREMS
jgi:hypothetical protein